MILPIFLHSSIELKRLSERVSTGQVGLWEHWHAFVAEMSYLGRREHSLLGIRDALQSLIRHGGILTIEQATPEAIRAYFLKQSKERNWKPWTYNSHRCRLNSYFKYLWEEGIIQTNPVRRTRAMSLVDVSRPTLSQGQSQRIIGHLLTRRPDTLVAHRNLVFVHLLCLTGCRVSEALNITIADLNFARQALRIPAAKGGKPRLVHIDANLERHLVRYLEYRHRIGRTDEWLLASASRKGRWTYAGVRKFLARLSEELGFKIHCHAFRRFAATQLAEQNLPIDQISQLLGHTNSRTTCLYINGCSTVLLRPCTESLAQVLKPVIERPMDVSRWSVPGAPTTLPGRLPSS